MWSILVTVASQQVCFCWVYFARQTQILSMIVGVLGDTLIIHMNELWHKKRRHSGDTLLQIDYCDVLEIDRNCNSAFNGHIHHRGSHGQIL